MGSETYRFQVDAHSSESLESSVILPLRNLLWCGERSRVEEKSRGREYRWFVHLRSDTIFHTALPALDSMVDEKGGLGAAVSAGFKDSGSQLQIAIGARSEMEVYMGSLTRLRTQALEAVLVDLWPPGWELVDVLSSVLEASNFSLVS